MPAIAPKYSDAQRSAIGETAAAQPELKARELSARASRGELVLDGARVPAFDVPPATVRTIRNRFLRQSTARARALIADRAPADAVEDLRRRLVVATDATLSSCERRIRSGKAGAVHGEELRQIARAVREIAAIPGPDGQPAAGRRPGSHIPGTRGETDGGPTRGGLAGSVMAAAQPRNPAPAPVYTDPNPTVGETGTTPAPATTPQPERINAEDEREPGLFVRAQMAELLPPADGA